MSGSMNYNANRCGRLTTNKLSSLALDVATVLASGDLLDSKFVSYNLGEANSSKCHFAKYLAQQFARDQVEPLNWATFK